MNDQPLLSHAAPKFIATGGLWGLGRYVEEVQFLLSLGATFCSFVLGVYWVGQVLYNMRNRWKKHGSIFKKED